LIGLNEHEKNHNLAYLLFTQKMINIAVLIIFFVMNYDKNEIFEQAKSAAVDNELIFIEDVISFLPCDKTTFYRFFTVGSNEYNTIKSLLTKNKVNTKKTLRKKWMDGDNATTQLALYKLCSTDEERKKLQQQYVDHTTKDQPIIPNLYFVDASEPETE